MKRLLSLIINIICISLILGFLEHFLPGHFDQDELFQGQTYSKLDFISIQARYFRVLFGLEWGASPLFAYSSARAAMMPYLVNSSKMLLYTFILSALFLVSLFAIQIAFPRARNFFKLISDIVLSIPLIFLLPLFFWTVKDHLIDWPEFYKMAFVSLIVTIKPTWLLWQTNDNYLNELKKELFVTTWFAMGGGPYKLVGYWLRKFWLYNILQWLPYLLSHFLMGSFLAANLLKIPSLSYLFIEALTVRDWQIFGPLTFLIAVLMLFAQYAVDIFSSEKKSYE